MLEEFVPRVYRFALRLTGDVHAAEELTQETFLRGWRARSSLRDPHATRVWLFQITANLWRDRLRQSNRELTEPIEQVDELTQRGCTIEQTAVHRENLAQALAAMERLPPRQRQVLHLRACEELSLAEIAQVLEISTNAVKSNLSAARQRIRAELRDLFDTIVGCGGGKTE